MEKKDWMSILRALLIGLISSFLLLAAGNLLALKSAHPDKLLTLLSYIALTGGALICGVAQNRGYGRWGLPAMTGGAYALVLLLISLAAGGWHRLGVRLVVYLAEGCVALLTSHFMPSRTGFRRSQHGKKAAYRYLGKG